VRNHCKHTHLSGGDNRLSNNVCPSDHVLLSQKDLLGRDLHAHITTGYHNCIGALQDSIIILDPFLVLNLGNDLDGLARRITAENLADVINILGLQRADYE
jgi:hypothetical protein